MLHLAEHLNKKTESITHSTLGNIDVESFETMDYVDDANAENGKRVITRYGKNWYFYIKVEGEEEELFSFCERDVFFNWREKKEITHTEQETLDEIREKIIDSIFDDEYCENRVVKAVFLFEYFGLDKNFLRQKIAIKMKDLELQFRDCQIALNDIGED